MERLVAALPDRMILPAYGALLAGMISGFSFGVAVTMSLSPTAEPAPVARLCEFPAELPTVAPGGDGIGFRILLDAAKRRGSDSHA